MNPTFKRYALIFIGGMVALCIVCVFLFSLIPASPETAAVDIATPLPDPTTPPPAPTATFNAASPDEVAYADFVVEYTENVGEQFREFRRLARLIGEDSQLLMDNGWRMEMAIVTAEIEVLSDEMIAYEAPPRFADLHGEVSGAAAKFSEAMGLVRDGLDTLQSEPMSRAATLIQEGSEILNAIPAKFDSLQ